jgi:hypothetical protein
MRLIALLGIGLSLSYRWVEVWRFMDCLYTSPLPAPTQCGGRRAVYALHIGANIYRIMKEEYGSTMRHFAALQRVFRVRPLAISRTHRSTSGPLNAGQRESCHIATKRSIQKEKQNGS